MRWSGTKAFLRPAMTRPNLTVVTNALTHKLRLEGRRVVGVEYSQGRGMHFAEARRETILSAGAIGSPQILQLSGIGPADLLQKHGIPVVHNLPVGENLQDHLQLRLAYKIQGAMTLNTLLGSWWYKARSQPSTR
jgi:choline dehydrogenase